MNDMECEEFLKQINNKVNHQNSNNGRGED